MRRGDVPEFSDRTFGESSQNDMALNIALNIIDPKYNYARGSKAKRLRGFWQVADDSPISVIINHLLPYTDTQIAIGRLQSLRSGWAAGCSRHRPAYRVGCAIRLLIGTGGTV
jgi:hypothetical protein